MCTIPQSKCRHPKSIRLATRNVEIQMLPAEIKRCPVGINLHHSKIKILARFDNHFDKIGTQAGTLLLMVCMTYPAVRFTQSIVLLTAKIEDTFGPMQDTFASASINTTTSVFPAPHISQSVRRNAPLPICITCRPRSSGSESLHVLFQ